MEETGTYHYSHPVTPLYHEVGGDSKAGPKKEGGGRGGKCI